ncbi:BapA/Bap/LapF family large adhesin [uncultured Paraglaciecola sp.]|uniref:BapA/Bap/LapF family large adhesin n=1 Tax=uncultured Paraglaciecola sp. TaxID=1765024 RepID=UPI002616F3BA|nr:BapA/Bap/LapF family large adhesin [uncultured Paraglaciecola sp.]
MTGQVKIIVHNSTRVVEEMTLVKGQNLFVRAMEDVTYEIKDVTTGTAPAEFVIKRIGNDLELYLDADSSMPDLVLENYYTLENPSPLVGVAEDGQFYTYVPQVGKEELLAWNMEDGDAAYQSLGYETAGSAIPWWPILLGGLLLLGGAAAIAASSGGGSDEPEDTTKPYKPEVDQPKNEIKDGKEVTVVTGTGEPGATAVVTDPETGEEIGTGEIDEAGNFEVIIDPAKSNGEELEVTVIDGSGNESGAVNTNAPDTTAPTPFTVDPTDGQFITGTGESGATVTVFGSGGENLGSKVVDESGKFTIPLNPTQTNGETLTVTQVDESGNPSSPAVEITAPDITAPDAPDVTSVVNSGEGVNEVTKVTGTGEPGTTVKVLGPNGTDVVGTGTVDESGNFTVDVTPALKNEEEITVTLTDVVTATNPDPKTSEPTSANAPDTTAPSAPESIKIGNGDEYITTDEIGFGNTVPVIVTLPGDAKAGDTVKITDGPNSTEIVLTAAHITAGEVTGLVSAPLDGEGLTVSAIITDAAGNESAPVSTTASRDTSVPSSDDNSIEFVDGDGFVNKTEAGADVDLTVEVEDDATIESIVITDENGNSATIATPSGNTATITSGALDGLTDGKLTVTMTVKDAAGNTGTVTDATILDTTAPIVLLNPLATSDTTPELSGTVNDPGAVVKVKIGENTYDAVNNGNGTWTLADDAIEEPGLAEGAVDITVTATDPAGNVGTTDAEDGTKQTITIDPDAVMVTFDDLVTKETITDLTGTVDSDAAVITVTIKGQPDQVFSSNANSDKFTITDDNNDGTYEWTLENVTVGEGNYPVIVTAELAGNTGVAGGSLIIDLTGPENGDGKNSIVFDDDFVNASEATAVTLSGKVESGATINSINITDGTTTHTVALADYTVVDGIVTVIGQDLSSLENGTLTVTMDVTDAAGNLGSVTDTTILSQSEPDADIEFEEVDGVFMSVITGSNAEPGSTVMVEDEDGNAVGDPALVDAAGNYTVPLNDVYIDGEEFTVTFTPSAGDPLPITAPIVDTLLAADNNEQLVLDVNPTKTDLDPESKVVVSFVNAGTGGVATADVIDIPDLNSMTFSVAENTEREITLKASGGGVSLANTFDLIIYKYNEELDTWQVEEDKTVEDWFTIIAFYGESQETSFALTEGEYRVALYNDGVAVVNGITLETVVNKTLDYNDPESVSGNITGNVIDDLDVNAGDDVVTNTTTVKSVNGTLLSNDGQLTIIEGTYGTLEINGKGGYVYTVKSGSVAGQKDEFEYTIIDTANPEKGESTATLSIELTREATDLFINTHTVSLTFDQPTPEDITSEGRTAPITNVGIVGVGLGPVADINAIPDQEQTMNIVVDENTVREVTLHATGGGLGVLNVVFYDLLVYRKDDSGNYVLVHKEEDWYQYYAPLLVGVGVSDEITLTLPAGEYIAFLEGDNLGIDVGSGTTMAVTKDILTDYSSLDLNTSTSNGTLDLGESDGVVGTDSLVLSVNGTKLVDGNPITIDGEFGTLTVNSDGTYDYETKDSLTSADFGKIDSFSYIYKGEDGERAAGRLNIKLDVSEIMDDAIDYTIDIENRVETVLDDSYSTSQIAAQNVTHNFTLVDETNNVITLNISADNVGAGETTLFYELVRIDDIDGVVERKVISTGIATENAPDFGEIIIYGKDFDTENTENTDVIAGNYELVVTSTQVLANQVRLNVDINVESTYINEYAVKELPEQQGNLFDNDTGKEYLSDMVINGKHMYLQGNLGNDDNSVEVIGKYGTLIVNNDGSYTYQANGEGIGEDVFEYTLTSTFGTTSTGQFTVTVGHNADTLEGFDESKAIYPDAWTEEPTADIASMSFASFDEPAEEEADEAELPDFGSLVDDSDSLALDGEPVAGSAAASEPAVDSMAAPETNNYLDDNTGSSDVLV